MKASVMASGCLRTIIFLGIMSQTFAVYPDVQGFDIFSGEHLDDTILPSDGNRQSFVHAVLVIYQKHCVDLLTKYDIRPHLLPMAKYVLLLWHDYTTSNTHTWYGFNGDDLRDRYNATQCIDVMFLQRGSTSLSSTIGWTPGTEVTFSDWVWEQIVVPVKINNHFGSEVKIKTINSGHTRGPRTYPEATLASEESVTLELYESTVIHIYMEGINSVTLEPKEALIGYWIVNGSLTVNVIPSGLEEVFENVMFQIQEESKVEDYKALETAWNTMQRHLLNLKQPLVVPQFTEQGYMKMKVPDELFKVMHDFYLANKKERVGEEWSYGDSVINQQKVQCSMVWLTDEVKEEVGDGLQSLLEEWAGIKLEMTAFYGIREYYGGNVLNNHVDRLDTHVISAIIQIDKNLDGEEDWLLEVVEYGGQRNEVALEPGDMLLYESARLIHGRPKTFKGKLYANAFLHFRPKVGWENYYHHETNSFTLFYPDSTEKLMPLQSDLTKKFGRHRPMQEVDGDKGDTRDEL